FIRFNKCYCVGSNTENRVEYLIKFLSIMFITSGPAGPSCVKGDSRCSEENRKDGKFSCSSTQPVLNRSSLKLACVIRSKGPTNMPNLVPIEEPVAPPWLVEFWQNMLLVCLFFFFSFFLVFLFFFSRERGQAKPMDRF